MQARLLSWACKIIEQSRLANGLFSGCVKDVNVIHVKRDGGLFADSQLRAWVDAGDKSILPTYQIQKDLIAHQLGHIHFDSHFFRVNISRDKLCIVDIFRTNAEDHILTFISFKWFGELTRNGNYEITGIHYQFAPILPQLAREEVHGR